MSSERLTMPTTLRSRDFAVAIPAEELGSRGIVGRPDKLLLVLGEISREPRHAFGSHPEAPLNRRA